MASGSNASPTWPRPPPADYVFNNLLADLSIVIKREELDDLKQRFKHVQDVQDVDTLRGLFDCLRDEGFIDQYNILYIQQIVRVLGKEALVRKLKRHVDVLGEDKVLHFIKNKKTANGYSQIEFHIKGHGISDPKQVETYRSVVASILVCPVDEVIINGIQATNSTVLTIMIPTMYATFLVKQLEKHSQRIISSFIAINVDTINVNNNKIELQIEGNIYKAKKESREHEPMHLATKISITLRRNANKQQTTNAQTPYKNERKRSFQNTEIVTRSHAKHVYPPRKIMRKHLTVC
ncbi:uncharacterized protein LOC132731445 [Ruditapes philippinarum]|uniref:uncharacterized protein LOC132731445 n=1 Tax=Ruditapes philippinarum TaxID=129788 RepID=UPI00295BA7AC|nr:uncharacterized protein LOC132731445 [Ruditapes philippinarum]XP_060573613.1 uncharacterized protein LOC132731445 [Ruditapes philippinarum]